MNQTTKWVLITVAAILSLCIISGTAIALVGGDDNKSKIEALQKTNRSLEGENKDLADQVDELENQEPETITKEVLSQTCKDALKATTSSIQDYNGLLVSIGEALDRWADNPYSADFDSVLAEQQVVNVSAVSAAEKAVACYPEVGE